MNTFSSKTCLNGTHQRFIFQNIMQIYLNTYWHTPVRLCERFDCCDHCISHRNDTSARSFSSTTLSRTRANFLHQTCIAGLVKHLSPTTYWTHLRVNGICAESCCPEKTNNRTLFLRDAFTSNVAIFIVYKWRHSDVIVIKLSCYLELNYVQNLYCKFFIFWILTELYWFVTYLWNNPRILILMFKK